VFERLRKCRSYLFHCLINTRHFLSLITLLLKHVIWLDERTQYANRKVHQEIVSRIVPFTWCGNGAHDWCNQSTEDVHSFWTFGPSSGISRGPGLPRPLIFIFYRTGCDRSTGDAYSSMAPDPTSDIFGGPCTPILWCVFPFRLTRLITDRYFCHFLFYRTYGIDDFVRYAILFSLVTLLKTKRGGPSDETSKASRTIPKQV
jgi:hypothetical protein